MRTLILYPGQQFSRLTVIGYSHEENGRKLWRLRCECGNERTATIARLLNGHIRSCGCLKSFANLAAQKGTHGMTRTPTHRIWSHMKSRRYNPRVPEFKNYGGRGISICERWRTSFENFLADMGKFPGKGYSIERIDNNGNYEFANCKWATKIEQIANRRNTVRLTYKGETKMLERWSEEFGIQSNTVRYRIRKGWSVEDALTIPVGSCFRYLKPKLE